MKAFCRYNCALLPSVNAVTARLTFEYVDLQVQSIPKNNPAMRKKARFSAVYQKQ